MTATSARTRQRQRRILLSVPDVALGAEIGLPEIAAEHLSRARPEFGWVP